MWPLCWSAAQPVSLSEEGIAILPVCPKEGGMASVLVSHGVEICFILNKIKRLGNIHIKMTYKCFRHANIISGLKTWWKYKMYSTGTLIKEKEYVILCESVKITNRVVSYAAVL